MKKFNSLKGRKAFKEVLTKGRRFYTGEMELIALKMNDNVNFIGEKTEVNNVSVGIQVNKKYGNAVSRNRARRRIRAALNEILRDLENNHFIILRPGIGFKSVNYPDLKKIIASLLVKAGVLKI